MSISSDRRKYLDKKGTSLAFLFSLLWSGNPISIKIGLEDAPALRLGWMRFLLGGLVAIIWAIYTKQTIKLNKTDLLPLCGVGLLFAIQLGFMNIGQSYTSAGHGVIMISTFPLWASVFSHIFIPKDKLNKKRLIGMIIAYLGIVILFWDSIFGTINDYLFGDLLMLCSALLLGARQIYISQIAQGIEQINILLSQAIIGIISFLFFSIIFEKEVFIFSYSLLLALIYQGIIIAGFGFIGQTWLLKNYLPSRVTLVSISQPIFGVILAWIILNEKPGLELIAATFFVVIGSYYSLQKKQ